MSYLAKIKSLVKIYRILYGKYKFQMVFLSVLGVINGILGSIGVVAIVPLLSVVLRQQTGEENTVSVYVEKLFHYFNWEPSIKILLIGIVVIFIIKAIILGIFEYIGGVINVKIGNEIRKDFFEQTLNTKWSYLVNQKISHLDFALNEDMGATMMLLNRMYDSFINFTAFVAYAITAFALSFYVTLFAVIVGGIILYFSKYLSWAIKSRSKRGTLLKRELSHNLNETILGIKAIKILRAEAGSVKDLNTLLDKMKDISLSMMKIRSALSNPIEPLMVIFVAALFSLSYKLPGFNFASFIVTVYLIQQIFLYTTKFQSMIGLWNTAIPSVERIMALKEELETNQETDEGTKDFNFTKELSFENVSFAYDSNPDKKILSSVSLKIKKGEMAGIIGPSGMGKTTIADLMMRLLKPAEGKILMDGVPVSDISLGGWRKNIGYVSQDVFLKDDTIENNIRFFNSTLPEKAITEAAKTANIFDFVKSLPDGFKTQVGDRGLSLSTGQRQRIALARVLAREPKILILDEATSSLDNESETLIKQSIEKMRGRITVIIIAHRLTTVLDTDHLIALKDGRIEEEGEPKKLLADRNSYFHKVYASAAK